MFSNAIIPSAQFRAIILCGYGSDLFPLIEPQAHSSGNSDEDPDAGEGDLVDSDDSEEDAEGAGGGAAGAGGKVVKGFKVNEELRRKDVGQIKSLLPVAGRRMIDWVLDLVEEAGVYDILILSPSSIAAPLTTHLRARRVASSIASGNLGVGVGVGSAKIDLEEVDDTIASKRGTVGVLSWAVGKGFIKSDFILLPCDLLLSPSSTNSTSLASLIDTHRINDNLLTTLFSYRSAGQILPAKKDGPAEILTIWDSASSTLLDVREMDEFDEGEIPLRNSLLRDFPRAMMSTALLPTQIHVLSSQVLDLLKDEKNERRLRHMDSLRDLIGWIARLSWRNRGRDNVGYSAPSALCVEDGLAKGRSTTQRPVGVENSLGVFEERGSGAGTPRKGGEGGKEGGRSDWERSNLAPSRQLSELNLNGLSTSSLPSHIVSTTLPTLPPPTTTLPLPPPTKSTTRSATTIGNASASTKKGATGLGGSGNGRGKCEIVFWRAEDGWCGRGNTVAGWIEMNRTAIKLLPPPTTTPLTPSGVFISPDTYLHPSAYEHMGEKVGLKRCIVGKGCWIGKGSKLTNCVLMEGVRVGEGVKLDNCVLSNSVTIGDRSVLKDCEFGRGVLVELDSTIKGEQIILEDD